MTSNLSKNIRKIREVKGIKQMEIALLLNKSQQFISKMENGKVDINEKDIDKIAKYLGIKRQELENFDEKILFQSSLISNSESNLPKHHFLAADERKIYQEYIELLREQNQNLQVENQRLKGLI